MPGPGNWAVTPDTERERQAILAGRQVTFGGTEERSYDVPIDTPATTRRTSQTRSPSREEFYRGLVRGGVRDGSDVEDVVMEVRGQERLEAAALDAEIDEAENFKVLQGKIIETEIKRNEYGLGLALTGHKNR